MGLGDEFWDINLSPVSDNRSHQTPNMVGGGGGLLTIIFIHIALLSFNFLKRTITTDIKTLAWSGEQTGEGFFFSPSTGRHAC